MKNHGVFSQASPRAKAVVLLRSGPTFLYLPFSISLGWQLRVRCATALHIHMPFYVVVFSSSPLPFLTHIFSSIHFITLCSTYFWYCHKSSLVIRVYTYTLLYHLPFCRWELWFIECDLHMQVYPASNYGKEPVTSVVAWQTPTSSAASLWQAAFPKHCDPVH